MSLKTRRILIVLIATCVVVLLVATSYTSHKKQNTSKQITVTTSFYPLFYFAQYIGGSHIHVTNITPAGAEPHDYEPTSADIIAIEQSKLLLLNGNGLESWGDRIEQNVPTKIVRVGDGLAKQSMNEDGKTVSDPHIWLSPKIAETMVQKISDALTEVDPAHAADYRNNTDTLLANLQKLDATFETQLTSCKTRSFITSHEAFGYLASSYNLQQISITGISPESEASQKDIAAIADFVKKNNIQYIFFESLVSPKLSETLAQETGTTTLVLDPLEDLTQQDIDAGRNYFSVMQQNLANLKIALQCTV